MEPACCACLARWASVDIVGAVREPPSQPSGIISRGRFANRPYDGFFLRGGSMPQQLSLDPRVRKLLKKGIKHHQAGRRGQAETCYRRSLKADPRCPQALHLLGLLAQQAGEYQESIRWIGEALAVSPDDPDTLNSMADAYLGQGQFQSASHFYQRL